jgi:tagaturonate epimerase
VTPALTMRGLELLDRSQVRVGAQLEIALARRAPGELVLVVRADDPRAIERFEGESSELDGASVLVGPAGAGNAAALRALAPWLVPQPLGPRRSVGLGDRLGLATPGHIRALRAAGRDAEGVAGAAREINHRAGLAPIFAQQSVRELDRIGRTAMQVLDDATWGVVAEGWREPFGADADHVKSPQDIDRFLECGYTQFTLDPGDHVRDEVEAAPAGELDELLAALPWERLRDTPADMRRRHAGRTVALVDRSLTLTEEDATRAAVKYGAAIAQVALLAEHLAGRVAPGAYEIEVSLDEAATPTTAAQHAFVAHELGRLGVSWVGLAPRFVGEMQKGIDYRGDLDRFARELAEHAQIAQALGPYKLSIHSGSDKFSLYPIAASIDAAAVHLKTSGTSYLEALRVLSLHDPDLLRRIYALALNRFAADRASYHLSVDAGALPAPDALSNGRLPALLDGDGTRQVLHVTFGSVLGGELGTELRERITGLHEEYAVALERHFVRHLRPFAARP